MRCDVLRETVLMGNYPASDLVWQADMAIRGPFYQVEGEYYHRRIHQGATVSLDKDELAKFYVPTGDATFDTKHVNMFRELTGVILRSPVGIGQKARMFGALARKGKWIHRDLAADLRRLLAGRSRAGGA
jgi:hypothetical protein